MPSWRCSRSRWASRLRKPANAPSAASPSRPPSAVAEDRLAGDREPLAQRLRFVRRFVARPQHRQVTPGPGPEVLPARPQPQVVDADEGLPVAVAVEGPLPLRAEAVVLG